MHAVLDDSGRLYQALAAPALAARPDDPHALGERLRRALHHEGQGDGDLVTRLRGADQLDRVHLREMGEHVVAVEAARSRGDRRASRARELQRGEVDVGDPGAAYERLDGAGRMGPLGVPGVGGDGEIEGPAAVVSVAVTAAVTAATAVAIAGSRRLGRDPRPVHRR